MANPLKCRPKLLPGRIVRTPETRERYEVCVRCDAYRDRARAAPGAGAAGAQGLGGGGG